MGKMKIAILLTCFNRKAKTLACLEAVYKALALVPEIEPTIFLVDDGCTDGTGTAVLSAFPSVQVLKGTGHLYWNGGMRLAFSEALAKQFDYYLWLNDDTLVYDTAFKNLVDSIEQVKTRSSAPYILVGSTQDDETKKLSHGGTRREGGLHPFKFALIAPQDALLECDTFNGNFVCISHKAATVLGNLDTNYIHAFGDYDYGFRAAKKGVPMYILPGFIGTCGKNSSQDTWRDTALSFRERLKKRHSNTGVPFANWFYFSRKHGGLLWPLWVVSPYVKLIASSILSRKGR